MGTTQVISAQIERRSPTKGITSEIVQHPYHLGTDRAVAETFVFEWLRSPDNMTVCLRQGDWKRIYDFRDLPEYQATQGEECDA